MLVIMSDPRKYGYTAQDLVRIFQSTPAHLTLDVAVALMSFVLHEMMLPSWYPDLVAIAARIGVTPAYLYGQRSDRDPKVHLKPEEAVRMLAEYAQVPLVDTLLAFPALWSWVRERQQLAQLVVQAYAFHTSPSPLPPSSDTSPTPPAFNTRSRTRTRRTV